MMASNNDKPSGTNAGRAARMGARIGKRLLKQLRSRVTANRSGLGPGPFEVAFVVDATDADPLTCTVESGQTLLAAAKAAGLELPHYCGGQCSCGTCRVAVLAGDDHLSTQQSLEQMVLGSSHVANGDRLACQARVLGPVRVHIPRWF